ncbi:uncharacterized protein UTRI_01058_B [Ustilago trichophora]|uniref:Uncharacterized protein n=1 Tax=Ustilago trichophora TaxID=86804 RepID=A0A5C3DTL2_9BASI|nr:uncharacterized protein UTRI_01058_B [Ustilago trichophora]
MKAFLSASALMFVSLLGIVNAYAGPTWLPDSAELNFEAFCGKDDDEKHARLYNTMHLCFLGKGDITQQLLMDPPTNTSGYYSTDKQNFVLVPFKPDDIANRALDQLLFTKDYNISVHWDEHQTVVVTVSPGSAGSNKVLLTSGYYDPGNVEHVHLYEYN